jgi:hypothetical protein
MCGLSNVPYVGGGLLLNKLQLIALYAWRVCGTVTSLPLYYVQHFSAHFSLNNVNTLSLSQSSSASPL